MAGSIALDARIDASKSPGPARPATTLAVPSDDVFRNTLDYEGTLGTVGMFGLLGGGVAGGLTAMSTASAGCGGMIALALVSGVAGAWLVTRAAELVLSRTIGERWVPAERSVDPAFGTNEPVPASIADLGGRPVAVVDGVQIMGPRSLEGVSAVKPQDAFKVARDQVMRDPEHKPRVVLRTFTGERFVLPYTGSEPISGASGSATSLTPAVETIITSAAVFRTQGGH